MTRDDLGAPLALEQGGDGAVDPAAHRDEDPVRPGVGEALVGGRSGRQRAVQRVGGELGGVALAGRQAAERRSTSSMPIAAASRTGSPSTISAAAAVAAARRAASLGVEARAPRSARLDLQRDPREIAAGGATGGAGEAPSAAGPQRLSSRR